MAADLDKPGVVLAATATGTAGVLVFALLPIYVGQITAQYQLDDVQSGLTASSYFLVYALISLTAPLWIRRFDWRMTAACGALAMLGGLTVLLLAEHATAMMAAMAVTGAGAAVLLPISLTLIADMANTERVYAITISLQQFVPALLLLGISAAWFGDYALHNTVYLTMAVVIACTLSSFALPAGGPAGSDRNRPRSGQRHLAIAGLIGLALNFAGFAAMWAFLERIAVDAGLGADFAAQWIAVGLFMTALGPLFSAWLGTRAGRLLPLVVPTAGAILAITLFALDISPAIYATVLVAFPLGYYVALNYILAVIADADPSGTLASLMSFALACGALAGPVLFGFLRGTDGAELVLIGAALGIGVGIIIWVQQRLSVMVQ